MGIPLDPRDEVGPLKMDGLKPAEVQVGSVEDDDAVGQDMHISCYVDLVHSGAGDHGEGRDLVVGIQDSMKLDRSLPPPEFRPGENAQAQRDDRGIEDPQGKREPEMFSTLT